MWLQDVSVDDLKTAIATSEGPVSQATQADYVKFHDDKVRSPPELVKFYGLAVRRMYASSAGLQQVDSLSVEALKQ